MRELRRELRRELQRKVDEALDVIEATALLHSAPVVYSSFGKDSMVLLNLVASTGRRLPVVFHREPHRQGRKYEFADDVIQERGYHTLDWDPAIVAVTQHPEGAIELVNLHRGPTGVLEYLGVGVLPPVDGVPYLCGLADLYRRPCSPSARPPLFYDLALIGHKSVDTDPIMGQLPLTSFYAPGEGEGIAYAFPLKEFTDQDIWEYTLACGLPINRRRYDAANAWREFTDDTFNPDYFRACTLCMDQTQPAEVMCPKLGQVVPNISSGLTRMAPGWRPAYTEQATCAGVAGEESAPLVEVSDGRS